MVLNIPNSSLSFKFRRTNWIYGQIFFQQNLKSCIELKNLSNQSGKKINSSASKPAEVVIKHFMARKLGFREVLK